MVLRKKRFFKIAAISFVFIAVFALFATVSFALEKVNNNIIYDLQVVDGYAVTLLTADDTPIVESDDGYHGVEKFTLSFNGVAEKQYAVFLMQSETGEVTESTLRYVYQFTGEEVNEIIIYPDDLSEIGAYQLVLSCGDSKETVATFYVKLKLVEGDIDKDGQVTIKDVLIAIKALLNNDKENVPDMNHDEKASLIDILRMLKLCV